MYTSTPIKKEGNAALYLRISDKTKQDVERQKKQIADWLNRHPDIRLTRKYVERETGRGGYVREKMNKLLRDAAANQFSIAIFWEVDRLGRDVYEALGRIRYLHEQGVKVYVADINQWYDHNDHASTLMLQQMLVFSEFEHKMNAKRTREGNAAKVDKIARRIKKGVLPKGARMGKCSILEQWIEDPDVKGSKKGLLCAPDPKKEAFFKGVWQDEECTNVYEVLGEVLRVPVNPHCNNKCAVDKPKNPQAKCHCNNIPSNKTIHKWRERLGLAPRNPHSFKRKDVPVETHEAILADLMGDALA